MKKRIGMFAGVLSTGLALLLTAAGCKTETVTVPVTVVKTIVATVTANAKNTPTTAPKLYSASFNLAIVQPNDYNAYLLPLYLTDDMILHMIWKVEGGAFRMTLTTPGGAVIPVTGKGVQTSGETEPLDYSGGMTFCISDDAYAGYDWGGDGYFIFTPHIVEGDSTPVKVALNYYFETKVEEEPVATTAAPATSATP